MASTLSRITSSTRAAITGLGILSCIGNSKEQVGRSLKMGLSGIVEDPERIKRGFKSPLTGKIKNFFPDQLGLKRKQLRSMCEPALFAHHAVRDAVIDAGLPKELLETGRCGVVFGNDSTLKAGVECVDIARKYGETRYIGTGSIFRLMNSTITMNLAAHFGIKGANWTISSACSSGSNALGQAYMLIKSGLQDIVIAGGAQETNWMSTAGFDALGAFSNRCNNPEHASRPFDAGRDGLVPSGGAACLIVENMEHALNRGSKIYGLIRGYGFSSSMGDNLSESNPRGVSMAMKNALKDAVIDVSEIDYINAHATSTRTGDRIEAKAIYDMFGDRVPVSSTKSITGHECWMSGASEALYTVLMARKNFLAPNVNFHGFEPGFPRIRIVKKSIDGKINFALSNSFGFGGTNAAIVFDFLNI